MEELVYKLRKHNVDITLVEDQLELHIPNDFDAEDILEEVKKNKEALLLFLRKQEVKTGLPRISRAPDRDLHPLSSAQKRLYFLHELDPMSLGYNMPHCYDLRGDLDAGLLESSLSLLASRHESLRTRIVDRGGEAFQEVLPEADFSLERFDAATADDVEGIVGGFVRPFDLGSAPLFRAGLVRVSQGHHVLMFDIHHIVTDGISQGILVGDFLKL
ncbi:condensation domain-containing protein, partial [Spongiimicrobium salis]|uniref:condensation domain-containing protein n=1 Tax=Spongiimicrobium salis TaxID=1667022 RepID=UPI00374CC01D